jgi:hypothetical protein
MRRHVVRLQNEVPFLRSPSPLFYIAPKNARNATSAGERPAAPPLPGNF